MSINIPDHFVQQYSSTVQLLLQQQGSMLAPFVTHGQYFGEDASPVNQIGKVKANKVTGRFEDMPRVDAKLERRWVAPSDYDVPQLLDKFDELRLLEDPESAYVQNAVLALGREKDSEIITAFIGAAKTGQKGAGSTAFPAANEIDVSVGGTNSRLNVEKLKAAKKFLRQKHVQFDRDPVFCGLTAEDEEALLGEIQITSKDFNGQDKPVMVDGKIVRFLGINFVYCELIEELATAGSNEVNVPVWALSGMHLGVWNDITAKIHERQDIRGIPIQTYAYGTFGATRLEEDKVVNIESYRS